MYCSNIHPTTIQSTTNQIVSTIFSITLPIILFIFLIIIYMMYKRRKTRLTLSSGKCNLPTVVWKPRFMNYTTQDDDGTDNDRDNIDWNNEECVMEWARSFINEHQISSNSNPTNSISPSTASTTIKKKMGSSSITNILPRMSKLNGPYGLYATVYGISTKVIHVAHPLPARAILTGSGVVDVTADDALGSSGGNNSSRRINSGSFHRRRSSLRRSTSSQTGSTKYPAYDHFKNFSGEGVFTANGSDWKVKRASVMHCLLRNSTATANTNSGGSVDGSGSKVTPVEMEANKAADSFEREVSFAINTKSGSSKKGEEEQKCNPEEVIVMNVVPMLQRSTIGLIYRLISHHNVEFGPTTADIIEEEEVNKKDGIPTLSPPSSGKISPRSSATSLPSMREDSQSDDENDEMKKEEGASSCSIDLSTATTTTTNSNKEKEEHIKSLLPIYLESVTRIRMIVLAQSRSFWYLLPRWVYKIFSPMYRDEERTMVPIREFAKLVCNNAMPGSPLALLSQRESHSGVTSTGQSQDNNVSKNLLDEAITLLFAGQDTSAATLSWTLHLLSLHPDKQERVAKEVRSVLGGINAESSTSKTSKPPVVLKSMISQMPYLDAVIKESMRLYPVAPFIVRKLTSDIAIPIEEEQQEEEDLASSNKESDVNTKKKTCSMPASTFACIWIYALHRNPKLWNRPNDFLPERWIDPELRARDIGQGEYGAYMPFAIGPRNCLGQPLAVVILRILLSRIVNKYVILDPKFEALQKLRKKDIDG